MERTFKEKLNSRKLALSVALCSTATFLLIGDAIQAEHWVTVIITIGGAYLATQAYVDKHQQG